MWNKNALITLVAGSAMLLAGGCNKQEPAADQIDSKPAPQAAAEAPKDVSAPKPIAEAAASAPASPVPAAPVPTEASKAAQAAPPPITQPSPVQPAALVPAVTTNKPAALPAAIEAKPAESAIATTNPVSRDALRQGLNVLLTSLANTNTAGSNTLAIAAQKVLSSQELQGATNSVQAGAVALTNQVQMLIERAKGLLSNQKYQDALGTVQQLYTNKLTADQRKVVDGLTTQIQTSLAKQTATNAAASILGNILGGKK